MTNRKVRNTAIACPAILTFNCNAALSRSLIFGYDEISSVEGIAQENLIAMRICNYGHACNNGRIR